jgi:hypothetical protein
VFEGEGGDGAADAAGDRLGWIAVDRLEKFEGGSAFAAAATSAGSPSAKTEGGA